MQNVPKNINLSFLLLQDIINKKLAGFIGKSLNGHVVYPELKLENELSPLNDFFKKCKPNTEELIILLLSLVPHIQPNLIDSIVQEYLPNGSDLPEIGGVKGTNHRGTIPTGETALFILAGTDINKRMEVAKYFSPDHFFAKENILYLETVKEGEPRNFTTRVY